MKLKIEQRKSRRGEQLKGAAIYGNQIGGRCFSILQLLTVRHGKERSFAGDLELIIECLEILLCPYVKIRMCLR